MVDLALIIFVDFVCSWLYSHWPWSTSSPLDQKCSLAGTYLTSSRRGSMNRRLPSQLMTSMMGISHNICALWWLCQMGWLLEGPFSLWQWLFSFGEGCSCISLWWQVAGWLLQMPNSWLLKWDSLWPWQQGATLSYLLTILLWWIS